MIVRRARVSDPERARAGSRKRDSGGGGALRIIGRSILFGVTGGLFSYREIGFKGCFNPEGACRRKRGREVTVLIGGRYGADVEASDVGEFNATRGSIIDHPIGPQERSAEDKTMPLTAFPQPDARERLE